MSDPESKVFPEQKSKVFPEQKSKVFPEIRDPLTTSQLREFGSKDLIFQALSWHVGDFEEETLDNGEFDPDDVAKKSVEIYVHGITEEGISVSLRILRFRPYFYVEIPEKWSTTSINKFYSFLKQKLFIKNKETENWDSISYALVSKTVVKKKKLYPFTNGEEFKFLRLIFSSQEAFKRCKSVLSNPITVPGIMRDARYFNMFESNVDPINRFCHIKDITTTGWIHLKKGSFDFETGPGEKIEDISDISDTELLDLYNPKMYSRAQLAVHANYKMVKPYLIETTLRNNVNNHKGDVVNTTQRPYDKIAPIKVLSWDIECLSGDGSFPNPKNPNDKLAQIGITIWKYGTKERTKMVITDRECDEVEGSHVIACDGEKDLLKTFCDLIEKTDPDFITGYNTWGFDDSYFWTRLSLFGLVNHASKFSRLVKVPVTLKTRFLSSSAYGNNEFNVIEFHGRETFDLLVAIRREYKLASYKLDEVGKHFTGQQKVDLPYKILFQKLVGSPQDVAEAGVYCVQDTNLVVEILEKLAFIPNNIEMAKATYVPMDWLLFRGQQCKVFSLVVKEARERGFVVPTRLPEARQDFTGATVLEPKRGAYYSAIAGLDFASLYPSIMIAYNMCYSTLVLDEKYKNLPGIIYEEVVWKGTNKESGIETNYSFTFIQKPETQSNGDVVGSNGYSGLLPTILEKLWLGRKATKREMNVEPDPFRKNVLNGKQLAQKVTMNSIYGFTGTGDKGMLPCKAIASSVTAKGRQMIDQTSELAQEMYSCETLYGDSIPGQEMVFLQNSSGSDMKLRIDSFTEILEKENEWKEYRLFKATDSSFRYGKQQMCDFKEDYYAKTNNGYSKIERVIRHKAPYKKLYKITVKDTDGSIRTVTVTEGHSLISEDSSLIKPDELQIGSKLISI